MTSRPGKQFCKNGHDTYTVGRGAQGHCKACHVINQRKYQEKLTISPATDKEATWSKANILNKAGQRFSFEDYVQLYVQQNKGCGVCRESKNLNVHADPTTRVAIGLLCTNCLALMEGARQKTEILQAAIEYLKRNITQN